MTTDSDRLAYRDLACRYARAADQRDFDDFDHVFTPDGTTSGYLNERDPSERSYLMEGHEQIRKGMRGLERYQATFHFVGNQLLEIDGDEGRGQTYCVAHHIYEQDGARMNYTMHIRYEDVLRRTDAGWRLHDRVLTHIFGSHAPVGENPSH